MELRKREEGGKVVIEAYSDSTHLLTFTYNKHIDMFALTVETNHIYQRSTLHALIEALQKVEEELKGGDEGWKKSWKSSLNYWNKLRRRES